MSVILDIAVIAVVVSLAFTGFRRGLINSVVDFAGMIVAMVAASLISASVSVMIYNQFIMDRIIDSVNQALQTLPSTAALPQQAEQIISSLPSYASNALAIMDIDANNLFSYLDTSILSIPQAVESLIRPVAIKVITAVVTVILFIIFMVIINLICKIITKAVNIVGLSTVNKLGGAAFGVVKAILLIMVLSFILYFIMMSLPTEASVTLNDAVENSHLYYGIYNISLPEKIISAFS